MPKSVSFTAPSTDTSTLCGVTSRCTTPSGVPSVSRCSCATWSPSHSPRATYTSASAESCFPAPLRPTISFESETPRTSSIAMK